MWRSTRVRRPVAFLGLLMALLLASTGLAPTPATAAPGAPAAAAPPGFVAIAPQRIIDTRPEHGGTGPVLADHTLSVALPPSVPMDASGLVLTVTSDQGADEGFVTAYPCGGTRPLASLLNPQHDEARSNQLIVALDSTRQVCLYSNTTVQLIVDLTGWLSPNGAGLHTVPTFRALDTRTGPRPDGGTGKPIGGSVVEIPLAGSHGIAGNATAIAANITLTDADDPGFVTAYPCGAPTPPTSTGNVPRGGTRASFTFVGLGSGSLCLFTAGPANLILDITGYFGPGAGLPVYPATPRRLLDTRTDGAGALAGAEHRVIRLGLPAGTTVAALNITAVDANAPGWVRVAPCGPDPGTSSVNYIAAAAIANLAMTAVGGEDSVCVTSNLTTHVVVDLAAASTQGTVAAFAVDGSPLYPAFRPDILDYVVFCADGPNPFTVHLAGETGAAVSLDGSLPANGLTSSFVLESGQGFAATFTGPGGNGTYRIRCLPPDFPQFATHRYGQSSAAYYLVTPPIDTGGSYIALFDREGVPVWWQHQDEATADAKVLQSPTRLVWSTTNAGVPFNTDPNVDYKVHDLAGHETGQIRAVGTPTDFHDMAVLANGNHLVTSYALRHHVDASAIGQGSDRDVVDAHIQEVTPAGTLVWEWHSEDHIGVNETTEIANFPYPNVGPVLDLVHVNAVSPDGNGIIVSARHLDAVFRVDKATGNLTWKLGGVPSVSPDVTNFHTVNDPDGGTRLQHDARVLPDGTLTVFDNRNFGNGQTRAARYQLNVPAGTATLIEQILNPDVGLSFFQGSARRLTSGTWVVNWGGSTITTEQAPTGTKLFQLTFATAVSYRSYPVEAGVLTRDELAAGMDAQHPR